MVRTKPLSSELKYLKSFGDAELDESSVVLHGSPLLSSPPVMLIVRLPAVVSPLSLVVMLDDGGVKLDN